MFASHSLDVYPSTVTVKQFDMWLANWGSQLEAAATVGAAARKNQLNKKKSDRQVAKVPSVSDWPPLVEPPLASPNVPRSPAPSHGRALPSFSPLSQASSSNHSEDSDASLDSLNTGFTSDADLTDAAEAVEVEVEEEEGDVGNDFGGTDDFGND